MALFWETYKGFDGEWRSFEHDKAMEYRPGKNPTRDLILIRTGGLMKKRILDFIKSLKWGYGALIAALSVAQYFRLLKLFGSKLLGAAVIAVAAALVLSLMRHKKI